MTSRNDLSVKLMDTGRIGVRLADQVRHQREVIQSLQKEKITANEKSQRLELELKRVNEALTKALSENATLTQSVDLLKTKLASHELDQKRTVKDNELLKLELEEIGKRTNDEILHYSKRISTVSNETEALAKENISMRLYVSRLETEVEISRRNMEDVSEARQRDGRIIDSIKLRIDALARKCSDLEDKLSESADKLKIVDREKAKSIASMEIILAEKNNAIATLEKSLRITTEEISAGEREIGIDSAALKNELLNKQAELDAMCVRLRVMDRDRQECLHQIDTLQHKYTRSKTHIRQLLETVKTYETTFEASMKYNHGSLVYEPPVS